MNFDWILTNKNIFGSKYSNSCEYLLLTYLWYNTIYPPSLIQNHFYISKNWILKLYAVFYISIIYSFQIEQNAVRVIIIAFILVALKVGFCIFLDLFVIVQVQGIQIEEFCGAYPL